MQGSWPTPDIRETPETSEMLYLGSFGFERCLCGDEFGAAILGRVAWSGCVFSPSRFSKPSGWLDVCWLAKAEAAGSSFVLHLCSFSYNE